MDYKNKGFLLSALIGIGMPLKAEITQDGSLVGSAGQAVLSSADATYLLDENQGQLNGTNLLFSFENFNVLAGEEAHFAANNPVSNVIARVTGGTASIIDGTVSSSIVGADVWLVNPSGLVFGENAQINVLGSFHASTANNLMFDDESVLTTDIEASPNLSIASPVSFGFLSDSISNITVNGSQFSLGQGEKLTLASHQIEIDNLNLSNVDFDVNFLSATASEGIAYVDAVYKTLVYSAVGSSLSISNSDISLLSSNTEALNLASETINLNNVTISVTSETADVHPEINVFGTDVNIFGGSSIIGTSLFEGSLGADVNIVACEAIDIYGETLIKTESLADGIKGGNVFIVGKDVAIRGGASIVTQADSFDGVNASAISDSTEIIDVSGPQAGSIVIVTENSLNLDGSNVISTSQSNSQGGLIRIDAGSMSMNNGALIAVNVSDDSIGSDIDIRVGELVIENTSTISMGLGVQGGGDILIMADEVKLTTAANIKTSTFEEGEGGNMYLDVNVLEITDEAMIEISESRKAVINAKQSFTVIASDDSSTTTGVTSGDLLLNSPDRSISSGSTVIAKNSLTSDVLVSGSSSDISISVELLDVLDDALGASDTLITTAEEKDESAEEENVAAISSNRTLRKTDMLSKSCHVKALSDRSSFVIVRNASSVHLAPSNYRLSQYPIVESTKAILETPVNLAMLSLSSSCF